MKKVNSLIDDYLANFPEITKAKKLGEPKKTKQELDLALIRQQNRTLSRKLMERRISNRTIIIIAIIIVLLLVLIAILIGYFAYRSGEAFNIVLALICTFFPMLGNIKWLGNRWKEDTVLLVMVEMLEGMKPEEAVKFIDAFRNSKVLKYKVLRQKS